MIIDPESLVKANPNAISVFRGDTNGESDRGRPG